MPLILPPCKEEEEGQVGKSTGLIPTGLILSIRWLLRLA